MHPQTDSESIALFRISTTPLKLDLNWCWTGTPLQTKFYHLKLNKALALQATISSGLMVQ